MNKVGILSCKALPIIAVMTSLCWLGQTAPAQSAKSFPVASAQQQPAPQADERKPSPETRTFTGRIMKSGGMLVLTDKQDQKTYNLDNQEMAKEFVDREVKVTGVLDESAGMIHVSAIEPA